MRHAPREGEALRWLRVTADVRIHGTTHEGPIGPWPAEADAFKSLDDRGHLRHQLRESPPGEPRGYLSYRASRYSVPPEHAGVPCWSKMG